VYHERSKVPGCDECEAPEENPPEFLQEVCDGRACAHGKEIDNPALDKLLHYFRLQNADCPVDRHELLDHEWVALGIVKGEWTRLEMEWHRSRHGDREAG